MKVGIIGTGDVGRVLGAGFIKHGHAVMIGSRDPNSEKLKTWLDGPGKRPVDPRVQVAATLAAVNFLST